MRDQAVNDLWLGQGDALRLWHEERESKDVAIVLNTGAGKTLVGLLAAQSLVNETDGHVAYACASIQLVQQTASKAESYGLSVTTYFESEFSDSSYHAGATPCITTYQALFNGLTRKWQDVDAVIFDDAHAATHIIRDQFTLRIDRERHVKAYRAVASAFAEHLRETDSAMGFREALEGRDPAARWFVPPLVIKRNFGDIGQALVDARLSQDASEKFPWGYLRDRIDLCATFITAREVTFTPPIVPVRALPYFGPKVRRIYLSATLAAEDAFLRTFGKVPDKVISPGTPAGQCERMVIVPSKVQGVADDVKAAKATISPRKALVMVPTMRDGAAWDDLVTPGLGDTAAEQVDQFKQAAAPAKLRLVARYDGVDLPGDTCRVMVIHGLPSGLGPLERFMWEKLRLHGVLRSTVASRIVQSFGRISRGMADHGVVLVVGKRLVEWLLAPANRRALPGFLRRQIELGFQVSERAEETQMAGLVEQCLRRDQGWVAYYGKFLAGGVDASPEVDPAFADAAAAEAEFGLRLWYREYAEAASVLTRNRQKFFDVGTGLGAWYLHWQGYLHEQLDQMEEATALYQSARKADKVMPSVLSVDGTESPADPDSAQLTEVTRYVRSNPRLLQGFDQETAALDGGSVAQTEEALRCLGTYLGLCSSRPDNDCGTGPDVLWYLPAMPAWSMELKTDKEAGVPYSKKNVMQAMDHVQWVRDNLDAVDRIVPMIIGDHRPADKRANPPPDLLVVDVSFLRGVRDRLRAALENVLASHLPVTLRADLAKAFGAHGLLWSQLAVADPGVPLRDVT